MPSNEERAREMFSRGISTNGVAKELGITWAAAKALKAECEAEAEPEQTPGEAEEAEPTEFNISVDVPAERLSDLIRGITPAEVLEVVLSMDGNTKALIFERWLRLSMEQILKPKTIDASKLLAMAP